MFVENVKGCDDVMLDDMNKDIVVTYVGIVVLHIIAVRYEPGRFLWLER